MRTYSAFIKVLRVKARENGKYNYILNRYLKIKYTGLIKVKSVFKMFRIVSEG